VIATAPSAFERHRARLEALDAPELLLGAVAEAVATLGVPTTATDWRRTREYYAPAREPYATFAMESRDPQVVVRVEAFAERPAGAAGVVRLRREAIGWLRVAPLADDPALPTLGELLDAEPGPRTVVRYQPMRRCTIRFGERGAARFAKVFADERGPSVHRLNEAVWRAPLPFAVPPPGHCDERLRTVWQGELAGEPVAGALSRPGGERVAHELGLAAGALTRAPIAADRMLDAAAHLHRAATHGRKIARVVPDLAAEVDELLGRLGALHAAAPSRPPVPVHGSPHPEQWLLDGDRLGLVDFDGLALADPELDASAMLVALERDAAIEHLASPFLDAYESAAGPLRPGLLAAHRAQRWLAAAHKAARQPRPDGDRRAAERLRRALTIVEEGR
jgi:hypothetical protein